jgi:hypothetical protein
MEREQTRDNSGVLFKASEKRSEKSPDYTGKVVIGGTTYRLSGWKKTTKDGSPYLSLAVRPMDAQPNGPRGDF